MNLTDADLFNDIKPATSMRPRAKIVSKYEYEDETNTVLFETVRYEPKDFRARRPDGKGGWIWNVKGVRFLLYRLPALRSIAAEHVFIAAGEKDVDRLMKMGITATTNPFGEKKWRPEYTEQLLEAGAKRVTILPDNDPTGVEHAEQVAKSCLAAGLVVKVLALPALPPKGDVSDWLNADRSRGREELEALAVAAPEYVATVANASAVLATEIPDPRSDPDGGDDTESSGRGGKRTQATILVDLVHEAGAELFRTPQGDAYFTVPVNDHRETYALGGAVANDWLARQYYQAERRTPNRTALTDAIGQLSGIAKFDGPTIDVSVRVAGDAQNVYVDLGDASWHVIHVDAVGWRIVQDAPVRFRRPQGLLSLPVPTAGGSITELRPFVNVVDDDDFALVVAWLVAALNPNGPYTHLAIHGEQGSAKSTTARILRRCFDPNSSDLRSEPQNLRDLMIAANSSWTCCFDNLSRMPEWLSDALCRVATGGGFMTRRLYSDSEEILFDLMRPVITTGINAVATRGDMVDRAVIIEAPVIPDHKRQPEAFLWPAFEAARPHILGALLDGVSAGIRCLPTITLEDSPRMADFARWGVATETAFPWPTGRFLSAYLKNRQGAIESVLDGDRLADCVKTIAPWSGTATDLLKQLNDRTPDDVKKDRTWFRTAQQVSNRLKRLAPLLRKVGIDIRTARTDTKRWIDLVKMSGGGPASDPDEPMTRPEGVSSGKLTEIGRNDEHDEADALKHISLPNAGQVADLSRRFDAERF